ncbi:MAG: glycine--tRNA ligase subunit beta, partial [Devosiaceae bacterium]|nr:glycine--tRNA ligase subunit beta [Devosiaceae bacterium]
GAAHDLVDAVVSKDSDDLLEVSRRVQALSSLIQSETGQSLLSGYRRGANILAAEEKKSGARFDGPVDLTLLNSDEETALAASIEAVRETSGKFVAQNNYEDAISALASLHQPVDAFFETVLVNDPDPAIRQNRLNLLTSLRTAMHQVADFSKVNG